MYGWFSEGSFPALHEKSKWQRESSTILKFCLLIFFLMYIALALFSLLGMLVLVPASNKADPDIAFCKDENTIKKYFYCVSKPQFLGKFILWKLSFFER